MRYVSVLSPTPALLSPSDTHTMMEVDFHTPMEIDHARFQPLTEAQHQHRQGNGLCLYCGNPATSTATARCGPSAPISSCMSCGGSSVVGAMSSNASRYSPSPCSYKSVQPLGGFSLQVILCFRSTSIHSHALLDSRASTCFINKSFFCAHNIPTVRTSQPISVEAIDNRVLSSGAVTEATIP